MPSTPLRPYILSRLSIHKAIDLVMANDLGPMHTDLVIEERKIAVKQFLTRLPEDERRRVCAAHARSLLSPELVERGYGVANIMRFVEWLESMGIPV